MESGPAPVGVVGVLMGAIGTFALFSEVSECDWERLVRYCGMWGVFMY